MNPRSVFFGGAWSNGIDGKLIRGTIRHPDLYQQNNPYAWIEWFGTGYGGGDCDGSQWLSGNLFPQALWNLSNVPMHSTCLKVKKKYTYGSGLTWNEQNQELTEKIYSLFSENVLECEDYRGTFEKWCTDYYIYGTYAFEVFWGYDGIPALDPQTGEPVLSKPTIKLVKYLDPSTVRLKKPDEKSCNIDACFVSRDWSTYQSRQRNNPVEIPLFTGRYRGNEREVFFFMGNRPGNSWYPVPEYFGLLPDIQTVYEMSYTIQTITKNGLIMPIIIGHPIMPTDEKAKKEFISSYDRNFGGPTGLQVMHVFGGRSKDGTVIMPDIKQLSPPDPGKLIAEVQAELANKIIMGHGLTPTIAGVYYSTGFNSEATLLATEIARYEAEYFSEEREKVVAGFRHVLRACGFPRNEVENVKLAPINHDRIYSIAAGEFLRQSASTLDPEAIVDPDLV
jgi:hypothetical protein